MGHTQPLYRLSGLKFILLVVCVLWLTVGAIIPAQAAPIRPSALSITRQPVRLLIPSLEVDVPIESVGKDTSGSMLAPARDDEVAWYNLGPRPGDLGNSVIAGHLDDVHGRPAAFWRLDELVVGDELIVRFGNGAEKHFAVMSVESYQNEVAPLDRIFGIDFEHDLNLITCDGQWNAQSRSYSQRLVVYARLIHENSDSPESNSTSPLPLTPPTGPTHARQDRAESSATR